MLLVVSPDVVLAVRASVAIIVGVTPVLLHIIYELSVYYASAGDRITTIVAHKCVGVLNAFLGNYLAHNLERNIVLALLRELGLWLVTLTLRAWWLNL
jgi:hypothetical protein